MRLCKRFRPIHDFSDEGVCNDCGKSRDELFKPYDHLIIVVKFSLLSFIIFTDGPLVAACCCKMEFGPPMALIKGELFHMLYEKDQYIDFGDGFGRKNYRLEKCIITRMK